MAKDSPGRHAAADGRPAASKARFVVPLFASCLGLALAAALMFPMLAMQPRDVPVGVVSLDRGVEVDGQDVNVGAIVVGELTGDEVERPEVLGDMELPGGTGGGDEDSAVSSGYVSADTVRWVVADDEDELRELVESGECYAGLVVPAGFSEHVVAQEGRNAIGAQMVENLPGLADGSQAIDEGVSALGEGSSTLVAGASKLATGAGEMASGMGALPEAADAAAAGAGTLETGLGKLATGVGNLKEGAESLEDGAAQANQSIEAALAALSSEEPDVQAAAAYLAGAGQATTAVLAGAGKLEEGAAAVEEGLLASGAGAGELRSGLGQLSQKAPALVSGGNTLATGAETLSGGMSSLAEGVGTLQGGTGEMASVLSRANEALAELPDADAGDSSIALIINQGKNPMVSNSLASAMAAVGARAGLAFDTSYINPLPDGMEMGFTHMILMILTYISSYATAAVIAATFRMRCEGARAAVGVFARQTCCAFAGACIIGAGATAILRWGTGADVDTTQIALFIALASFAFQMLVLGSLDLFGAPGMAVPIGLLVIGMGTAYLPTEFLPEFWRQWVYPWDPLRYMADGFRGILYMGQGAWNPSTPAILSMAGIGLVLVAAKVASLSRRRISRRHAVLART